MQGRLNSPLTEQGKVQADAHGAVLKRLGGVDHLWVSTAGRAQQTAALVNAHLQAPLEYSDMLVERDCGQWAGKTLSDLNLKTPTDCKRCVMTITTDQEAARTWLIWVLGLHP